MIMLRIAILLALCLTLQIGCKKHTKSKIAPARPNTNDPQIPLLPADEDRDVDDRDVDDDDAVEDPDTVNVGVNAIIPAPLTFEAGTPAKVMWSNPNQELTWSQADELCKKYQELDGASWQLPTRKQVRSIGDIGSITELSGFTKETQIWTFETDPAKSDHHYTMKIGDNSITDDKELESLVPDNGEKMKVLCVKK